MAIAVLDTAGHVKAFASEDGASMLRFDIARAKAWGAIGMGASSRVLGDRAKDNPNFFVSLAASSGGVIFASDRRSAHQERGWRSYRVGGCEWWHS